MVKQWDRCRVGPPSQIARYARGTGALKTRNTYCTVVYGVRHDCHARSGSRPPTGSHKNDETFF